MSDSKICFVHLLLGGFTFGFAWGFKNFCLHEVIIFRVMWYYESCTRKTVTHRIYISLLSHRVIRNPGSSDNYEPGWAKRLGWYPNYSWRLVFKTCIKGSHWVKLFLWHSKLVMQWFRLRLDMHESIHKHCTMQLFTIQ